MLQVNIHQVFGMIGIRYQSGQWNLSAPAADLQIHQTNPDVSFQRTPGDLEIDQNQAFADAWRETPLAFIQDLAGQAKMAAQTRVADDVAFGDQVMKSNGSQQAQKVVTGHEMQQAIRQRDVSPALVPRPFSVHVHYTLSQLQADFHPGQLSIETGIQPVRITDFSPSKAEVYLQQPPAVSITTSDSGQRFDKNA